MGTVNVGFGNFLSVENIIAIMPFATSTAYQVAESAKNDNKFIDFAGNHKPYSLILLADGFVAQSAISALALAGRINRM